MVDNRYATALVIGSVLSLLAAVYLSVAVGTHQWFQYNSPLFKEVVNHTVAKHEFMSEELDEKTHSEHLFRLNGTLSLWWWCIQVPSQSLWYRAPVLGPGLLFVMVMDGLVDFWPLPFTLDPKMENFCMTITLPEQFQEKWYADEKTKDLLRTYLWRCQFVLPLVSLALVFLGGLVGVCACLCRSFKPMLVVGVLHFIAGLCSLGAVCCFRINVDLLNLNFEKPEDVDGSMGWSLYLALISFPLQMMAAALFLWAARSHRQHYSRITAYRVAYIRGE